VSVSFCRLLNYSSAVRLIVLYSFVAQIDPQTMVPSTLPKNTKRPAGDKKVAKRDKKTATKDNKTAKQNKKAEMNDAIARAREQMMARYGLPGLEKLAFASSNGSSETSIAAPKNNIQAVVNPQIQRKRAARDEEAHEAGALPAAKKRRVSIERSRNSIVTPVCSRKDTATPVPVNPSGPELSSNLARRPTSAAPLSAVERRPASAAPPSAAPPSSAKPRPPSAAPPSAAMSRPASAAPPSAPERRPAAAASSINSEVSKFDVTVSAMKVLDASVVHEAAKLKEQQRRRQLAAASSNSSISCLDRHVEHMIEKWLGDDRNLVCPLG
jgi:hypothetical protein